MLALVVIHSAAPGLLLKLLESPDLLQKITLLALSSHKNEKDQDAAKKVIRSLLADSAIRKQDRPRLEALLLHVGEGGVWPAETVANTGALLHTSPVMTGREAHEGLVAAEGGSGALDGWLERFAAKEDRSKSEVRRAFFDQLLASHSRTMEAGIWSHPDDGVQRAIPMVVKIVKAIEILLFDLEAASEFGPEELERLRASFSQWAHFIHPPDYLPARRAETKALLRFADAPELDPLAALDRLAPLHPIDEKEGENEGEAARRRLNLAFIEALERRAATAFVNGFDKQDLVATFDGQRRAGEYLLRGDGLIWRLGFRSLLREALDRDKSIARSDNAMQLLSALVNRFSRPNDPVVPDAELVQLLWNVASSVAPNMRMFESIERLRGAAERLAGLNLADPTWWKAKREQYLAAKGEGAASR